MSAVRVGSRTDTAGYLVVSEVRLHIDTLPQVAPAALRGTRAPALAGAGGGSGARRCIPLACTPRPDASPAAPGALLAVGGLLRQCATTPRASGRVSPLVCSSPLRLFGMEAMNLFFFFRVKVLRGALRDPLQMLQTPVRQWAGGSSLLPRLISRASAQNMTFGVHVADALLAACSQGSRPAAGVGCRLHVTCTESQLGHSACT